MNITVLEEVDEIKDVGVYYDSLQLHGGSVVGRWTCDLQ